MRFDIITIFPKIFDSYINESILKRAQQKKLVRIHTHDLRAYTRDKHRKVDNSPYGGGAGMVLAAEPVVRATDAIMKLAKSKRTKIILFSAKGRLFNQKMAYQYAWQFNRIIMITGRYEGIDERATQILKKEYKNKFEEISIGPYVLTDGDIAAMVMASAIARLIPGVIKIESLKEESHWNLLLKKEKNVVVHSTLEYPHFTRPEILTWKSKKYSVPKALLSGDHKKIEAWRKSKSAPSR